MKGGGDMSVQNTHFICEICGDYDVVLSSLNLRCNMVAKMTERNLNCIFAETVQTGYMNVSKENAT